MKLVSRTCYLFLLESFEILDIRSGGTVPLTKVGSWAKQSRTSRVIATASRSIQSEYQELPGKLTKFQHANVKSRNIET